MPGQARHDRWVWGFTETHAAQPCQFAQVRLARHSPYGVLGAEPLGHFDKLSAAEGVA